MRSGGARREKYLLTVFLKTAPDSMVEPKTYRLPYASDSERTLFQKKQAATDCCLLIAMPCILDEIFLELKICEKTVFL